MPVISDCAVFKDDLGALWEKVEGIWSQRKNLCKQTQWRKHTMCWGNKTVQFGDYEAGVIEGSVKWWDWKDKLGPDCERPCKPYERVWTLSCCQGEDNGEL